MDWRGLDARGQVADWRDRHLLLAAAAVNAIAVDALARVERDLEDRTRDDPLDDGFDRARERADRLIRSGCEAKLGPLLGAAARELRAIGAWAEGAALALSRDGWPPLPPCPPERSAETLQTQVEAEADVEPVGDQASLAWRLGRRLASIDRALVEGARAGARATAVLGDVVRDWTGYYTRVRAHAKAHAGELLFTGSPGRSGVLPHLEAAIDAAAAAARKEFA